MLNQNPRAIYTRPENPSTRTWVAKQRDFEMAFEGAHEVQVQSDSVRCLERQRDQDDVGKRKEGAHFAVVTAKHFPSVSIACG